MTRFYWLFTTGAGLAVLLAALLGLVVGIVVVAQTIYATTMDHLREYGALKAMGATNRYLYGVIVQERLFVRSSAMPSGWPRVSSWCAGARKAGQPSSSLQEWL